ncbi:STAS-like domain-containing protein [Patescibacteria group bacterium]|nr:STAS-like domain-containing protein [Patescibacteria group bacterium]
MKKFGTTLNSRQFGKESFAAFKPSLIGVKNDEKIIVDFEGVVTFTPSWGDEFLYPLFNRFGKRLMLKNTENPSVQATLKLLGKIYGENFRWQFPCAL